MARKSVFYEELSIHVICRYQVVTSKVVSLIIDGTQTYIFISEIAYNVDISPGVANKLPLEESDVDDR